MFGVHVFDRPLPRRAAVDSDAEHCARPVRALSYAPAKLARIKSVLTGITGLINLAILLSMGFGVALFWGAIVGNTKFDISLPNSIAPFGSGLPDTANTNNANLDAGSDALTSFGNLTVPKLSKNPLKIAQVSYASVSDGLWEPKLKTDLVETPAENLDSPNHILLAGHSAIGNQTGVLSKLSELKVGDIAITTSSKGNRYWVLEKIFSAPYGSVTVESHLASYGKDHKLSLITCGGTWNSHTRHYSHNIVTIFKEIS